MTRAKTSINISNTIEHSVELLAVMALTRALKLPDVRLELAAALERAQSEGASHLAFLRTLLEAEHQARQTRRIERLRQSSSLPAGKHRHTLALEHLPGKVRRQLPALLEGAFLSGKENVLLFGKPGTGKTHLACAIGHALIALGHPVLFVTAQMLLQRLLKAKQSLELERALLKLDRFDAVILDDIGYVEQSREEMEVLFTFLAERYERKSVIITSNLVFSQWNTIFKDPMTTAAAIDRLVHHSTIIELTQDSYRTMEAKQNQQNQLKPSANQPQT